LTDETAEPVRPQPASELVIHGSEKYLLTLKWKRNKKDYILKENISNINTSRKMSSVFVLGRKKISLGTVVFTEEMKKAAIDALENESFVLGESVFKFEEEFAKYCGVDYAVAVSSGTDALNFCCEALGIKGSKVITTPMSYISSANCIIFAGGTPVFADIDETANIDPKEILKAIGPNTKGVLPVHFHGYPCDMDSITDIAEKHGLYLIEDVCQAHGGMYNGKKLGSFGDAGCFSFYPRKNMTVCGDGGMVTTNNEKLAKTIAKMREHGHTHREYVHDIMGYTGRLNTVNAAIGRVQLKHLDEWNNKRRQNAKLYDHLLSDLQEEGYLTLPPKESESIKPAYFMYVINTPRRDELRLWLEKNGIECDIHYPLPLHLQPLYKKMFNYKEGDYPRSEEFSRTCLSIPMHQLLTPEEIKFVSEKIREFFEGFFVGGTLIKSFLFKNNTLKEYSEKGQK